MCNQGKGKLSESLMNTRNWCKSSTNTKI